MIAELCCRRQCNTRHQQDDVTHAKSMLEQDSLSKKVTCAKKEGEARSITIDKNRGQIQIMIK